MGTTIVVTTDLTYNSLMNKSKSDLAHLVLTLADMNSDLQNALTTPEGSPEPSGTDATRSRPEQLIEADPISLGLKLRCRDCVNWKMNKLNHRFGHCYLWKIETDADDACHRFERKQTHRAA
jgi:hypothetical protein